MNPKGCPKGARVHWLLFSLSDRFHSGYFAHYDYTFHNYFFMKAVGKISATNIFKQDFFIVCRTSKRCWRVVGHDMATGESVFKSLRTSQNVADYLDEVSQKWAERRATLPEDNGMTVCVKHPPQGG